VKSLMPLWDLPARRQLILLACLAAVACSVELAPEEKDPGFTGIGGTVSGGAAGNGSEGGVIGGGSGGFQGGSGGASGSGGVPAGGTGAGGVIGGAGGFGAGGAIGGFGGIGAGGGGGTGNLPPVFQCDPSIVNNPQCYNLNLQYCWCAGCESPTCDGFRPDYFPDCTCPECWSEPYCNTDCSTNGLCDPYNEGCGCPDCYDHPDC
jgi:hypothetical protein